MKGLNTLRKILVLLLALLSLTACGGRNVGDNSVELAPSAANGEEAPGDWRMTKMLECDADGSIGNWYESEYDARGNEIKWTCFNGDGSIRNWVEKEVDARGNKTKSTVFDFDGSIESWTEYQYDAHEAFCQVCFF